MLFIRPLRSRSVFLPVFLLAFGSLILSGTPDRSHATPVIPASWQVAAASFTFVDITEESGLPLLVVQNEGAGVKFARMNDDSHYDLLRYGQLFPGNGDGTFGAPYDFPGFEGENVPGIAPGDYDNDGDEDLWLIAAFSTSRSGYFTNVGGGFVDNSDSAGLQYTGRVRDILVADLNGDGNLDAYNVNGSSSSPSVTRNALWLGNGDGTFTNYSAASQANVDTNSGNAIGFDYDNDGDLDLYTTGTQPRGTHYLFRNNGAAVFENVNQEAGLASPLDEHGYADFGDFDNDGDFDLIVANFDSGIQLFRNEADGTFTDIAATVSLGSLAGTNSSIPRFMDLDHDGYLDLVLFNLNGATRSFVFQNKQGAEFDDVTNDVNGGFFDSSLSMAWGDMDADGDPDFYCTKFYRDEDDVQQLVRLDQQNNNHYLTLALQGTFSNADGIGSCVTAQVGSMVLMRQAGGHTGDTAEVVLGLGEATQVDSLTVRWPSGITQTLENVAANQRLVVIEDGVPPTPTPTPPVTPTPTQTPAPTFTPTATPFYTPQPVTVSVFPATSEFRYPPDHTGLSETAFITVRIENAVNLGAFEFDLTYSPQVASITDTSAIAFGGFLDSTGNTIVPLGPLLDDEQGVVQMGQYSLGTSPGADGDGVLANLVMVADLVEFSTTMNVTLEDLVMADVSGNAVPVQVNNAVIVSCFYADIDCNNEINILDVQGVAGAWNTSVVPEDESPLDVNRDGVIDISDVQLVASWWGYEAPFVR